MANYWGGYLRLLGRQRNYLGDFQGISGLTARNYLAGKRNWFLQGPVWQGLGLAKIGTHFHFNLLRARFFPILKNLKNLPFLKRFQFPEENFIWLLIGVYWANVAGAFELPCLAFIGKRKPPKTVNYGLKIFWGCRVAENWARVGFLAKNIWGN